MSARLYRVIFCGETRPDWGVADIRRNLARVLRVRVIAVYRLFTGQPVELRRGLSAADARRFVTAMVRAGAVVRMELMPVGETANAGNRVERRRADRRQQAERRHRLRHSSFFYDRRHSAGRRATDLD